MVVLFRRGRHLDVLCGLLLLLLFCDGTITKNVLKNEECCCNNNTIDDDEWVKKKKKKEKEEMGG